MAFKKVLLIKPSKTKTSVGAIFLEPIPLGLEYIAAYINSHVNMVDIIDLANDSYGIEYYLRKLKPDLVGISITYTVEHNEALKIAKKTKQFGASVVIGGYHATGMAEELAAHPDIDFVVRGEGEETMLELVQRGAAEGVRGVSYSQDRKVIHNPDRPLIKDLDSIPYPARNLRKYKYKVFNYENEFDAIMTSRGCWGKCKFCCEPMMCKGIQRYRKPEDIIKEVEKIARFHKYKKLIIIINDPNFGGNPKIAEELCDRLIEFISNNNFEIEFIAPSRVDVISNNEILVKKMIKAGIYTIELGMESPNEKHLSLMNKGITNEMQENAIKNIKNNGGKIIGTFILGLPYQTEEDMHICFEYVKVLKIDYPIFSIAIPWPGTEFYNELKSKSLIIEQNWDKYDHPNLVFKHEHLTSKQLREFILRTNFIFYKDLVIKLEYSAFLLNNKKNSLYVFAAKIISFFILAVSVTIKGEGDLLYLKELVNPDLKEFTKEIGLHKIIEMSRFLKIIGKQKIQIALYIINEPIVVWIIKTTKNSVEYIDTISNIEKDVSIIISLPLDDIISIKSSSDLFGIYKTIIFNIFKYNKGIVSKFNLIRLFIALVFEVLSYNINRIIS